MPTSQDTEALQKAVLESETLYMTHAETLRQQRQQIAPTRLRNISAI